MDPKYKPKGRLFLNRYCISAKQGDLILALQPKSDTIIGIGIILGDPEQGTLPQSGYQRTTHWVALPANTIIPGIQIEGSGIFRKFKGSGLRLLDQLYPPTTRQK